MTWNTTYYHHDGVGSTRQLTDASQNITDTYVYNAYGEQLASTGTTVNPFRYVGQTGYYHDNDGGTCYVRNRHYNPSAARWISEDPLQYWSHLAFQSGLAGLRLSKFSAQVALSVTQFVIATLSNLYTYCGNAPTGANDPSGLDHKATGIGKIVGAVAAIPQFQSRIDYTCGLRSWEDIEYGDDSPDFYNDLLSVARKLQRKGGKVNTIVVKGHAFELSINDDNNLSALTYAGQVLYVEIAPDKTVDITATLKAITGPGTHISLRGCNSAKLAKKLAAILNNGTTVSGYVSKPFGIPFTDACVDIPFISDNQTYGGK